MKIACEFSHLGGSEILEQRYPELDKEIYEVINSVVGEKNKVSKEKNRIGKLLYSPKAFKAEFKNYFESFDFEDLVHHYEYRICNSNKKVTGYKKIDFFKDNVAVQVQFGKYSFMTYDLAKFQYFFNENKIDLGIEIVPSYLLQKEMSSGMGYGEQLISDIKLLKNNFPMAPVKIIVVDVERESLF